MSDVDAIRHVFEEAAARMAAGRQTYGEFDPTTDRRNLPREAEEELLDAINYLAMAILKIRALG